MINPYPRSLLNMLVSAQLYGLNTTVGTTSLNLEKVEKFKHPHIPDNEVKRIMDAALAAKDDLPTKYEDPITYRLYKMLFDNLVVIFNHRGQKLPRSILIGTAPADRVSATASYFGSQQQECLIIMNRHTIPFCYQFSSFIVSILPIYYSRSYSVLQRRAIIEPPTIEDCRNLFKIIADLISKMHLEYDDEGEIVALTYDRSPGRPQLHVEKDMFIVRSAITDSMEYFILAHEMMHLSVAAMKSDNELKTDTLPNNSIDEEHYCDINGNILAQNAMACLCPQDDADRWKPFSFLGGLIFLSCLELLEKAEHVTKFGYESSASNNSDCTHPDIHYRKKVLIDNLIIAGQQLNDPALQEALQFWSWWGAYLPYTWSVIREWFEASHRNVTIRTKMS
jgi:hypothetical protein